MEATRRGFLKGLSALMLAVTTIHDAPEQKELLNSDFPKYCSNYVSQPELGPGYRWVNKEMMKKRLEQGYRFIGPRPILWGGTFILMKKETKDAQDRS